MQTRISRLTTKGRLAELCAKRILSDIEDEYGDICDFADKLTGYPEQHLLRIAESAIDCLSLGGTLTAPDEPHCIIANANDTQQYEDAGSYSGLPDALAFLASDITAKAERSGALGLDHIHLSQSDKDPHLVRWSGRSSSGYFYPIGRVMVILNAAHILYPPKAKA